MKLQKRRNQGVQCTLTNSFTNGNKNNNTKEISSTKSNIINQKKHDLEFYPKIDNQSKFYDIINYYYIYIFYKH